MLSGNLKTGRAKRDRQKKTGMPNGKKSERSHSKAHHTFLGLLKVIISAILCKALQGQAKNQPDLVSTHHCGVLLNLLLSLLEVLTLQILITLVNCEFILLSPPAPIQSKLMQFIETMWVSVSHGYPTKEMGSEMIKYSSSMWPWSI